MKMTVQFTLKKSLIPTLATALLFCVISGRLSADEYRIGSSDVLEISFWQDVRLNATVTVNDNGRVTLDIVGEIEVAGKTTTELQDEIVRKISRLNRDISQAVVRVTEYNHNYVYVNGQANITGKLTFERIPDLWAIINEAGGVTNLADLSRVTVIKGGEESGRVEIVNIAQMIAHGRLDKLPVIERGDAIEIPVTPGGLLSGDLVENVGRKKIIYVMGEVGTPGPIQFNGTMDIIELLALAGGPSPNADLSHMKIISRDGDYAQTMTFNFEEYSKSKTAARYVLKEEDTFFVPRKSTGFFSGLNFATVTGILAAGVTVFILIDNVKGNDVP